MTPQDRFWAKVDRTIVDGCWTWTACRDGDGYGRFYLDGRPWTAHRAAYALTHGPILAGLMVDHICRNPPCVNPAHLQLKSNSENQQNRRGAARHSGTGVRGVSFKHGRYVVSATEGGVRYYGGQFKTVAEAERAAVALRHEVHTNNLLDRKEKP